MRKLIRKGQWGLNTGNIGAMDLKLNTPPMEPKLQTSSSLGSIFGNNSGPSLNQSDGLSFFGNSGLSSTLSTAGSYLGAKYGGEFLKNGATKLTEGFGKQLFKGMGGTSGLVSLGSNLVTSMLPERVQSDAYKKVQGALNLAKNIPGVGGLIATGLSTALEVTDWLGQKQIANLNDNQDIQDTLANTGGGYGDFMADWDEAKQYAGKNVGFWTGASKYNNMVYDANRKMSKLQGIIGQNMTNNLLTAQMGDRWNEHTMMDMNGGIGNISFGRLGLKIEILDKVHSILNRPKVVDSLTEFQEEIPEFKEGGKMNVIPEGSLHARLHHMENADGLTKKGIPVVSIAEGGELEQQAEIELNEIIFRLEVTQELEKLMEDGSDNAAIEAGKLLVKEIFENTDDRTGLIKQLEPEKKETTTEDIVKNHQVF